MKILIVCPDWFPNISGFGTACYQFVKELQNQKHEVIILVPKIKDLDNKQLKIITVPKLFNLLGRNPFVVNYLPKLRKYSKEADIILLYSYMFEMNSRVIFFKKIGLLKKPIILMYRGSLEDDVLKNLSFVTKIAKILWDKTLGKFLFENVDIVISNAKNAIPVMLKKYSLNRERLYYVPNSIYVNEYKKSDLNNKRVLFVGRLIENKGIDHFEDILKTIPLNWRFTIIGDGPIRKKILQLKEKYVQLEYLGKLSPEKMKDIYSNSDILVLPTYAEGSPRVVMEASAAGVPSIVYGVGDVPQIVLKNTGFCIKPFEKNDFLEKLELLIKNQELRILLGKNAKKHAYNYMDWKINYQKTMDIIEKCVSDFNNP